MVHLFEDTSSVVKSKRVYHSVRNDPVVVETVKTAIRENATTSIRKIARENNISKSSVQRILKKKNLSIQNFPSSRTAEKRL
ncbi:hypothetical protein BDFB_015221 [Asbolus verrucosus]|uniref:HTH 29 domain containing protein n=1 Tax=Asbolus verrucosus TaxID=1661398 RepID=A0A482W4E6_ASBVE|nr:hypothetical protein BDFB_015221 [Asbolus verrucosus]